MRSSNEEDFLEAWKKAVKLIGPSYFGPKNLESAKEKWDLAPKCELIEKTFRAWSGGEKQFAGAILSFYNDEWAAELMAPTSYEKSVNGLTFNLDCKRRKIVLELFWTYPGW